MILADIVRSHAEHNPAWRRLPFPRRQCQDGFSISVQVGFGMYCAPRYPSYDRPERFIGLDDIAPPVPRYTSAECGMPSERPEPWEIWRNYLDGDPDADSPTKTVYGYVPIEIIQALLDMHGGEVEVSIADEMIQFMKERGQ